MTFGVRAATSSQTVPGRISTGCIALLAGIGISLVRSVGTLAQSQTLESFDARREIWIAPQSLPLPPLARDADFMEMFTADAPWNVAAAHTRVFKLYASYVEHAPQEQINTIVANLNSRGIEIGLEVGTMDVGTAKSGAPCGGYGRVEGYGTTGEARKISKMIKAAGGLLKYIAMDEVIYYGHYYSGPHACHSAISEIIGLIVPTLNVYLEEFPDVVIGEVEPTNIADYPGWRKELLEWSTQFRMTLERPLAFVQLDIPWANGPPSKEPEDALAFYRYEQQLQQQSLVQRIGVINDGTPLDSTDAAWVEDAKRHVLLLEQVYCLRPELEIFQSWMVHPSHALPESDPDTLTSLIPWYVGAHISECAHHGRTGPRR